VSASDRSGGVEGLFWPALMVYAGFDALD